MKRFLLAAIAVLSLGIGAANAAQSLTRNGVVIWGPDFGHDVSGG